MGNTLQQTKDSIAAINEQITKLKEKKTQLEGDIELKKKALAAEVQARQADNQSHHNQVEEMNRNIQQDKAKADQLVIDIQHQTELLNKEKATEADLKTQVHELENKLKDAISKKDECFAQVKRLEDAQAAQSQTHHNAISEMEGKITILKQQLAVATAELESKSGEENQLKQQLEDEKKAIEVDKMRIQETKEKINNVEEEKKKAKDPKHCLSI